MANGNSLQDILKTIEGRKFPANAQPPHLYLDATVAHPTLTATGFDLYRKSKVAVVMVAGGLSTRRLGWG